MLSIPAVSLVAEERTLRGSYLGSCVPEIDVPRFVALHAEGKLPVEPLLTHRLTLDDLNEGFDRLREGHAVRQVVGRRLRMVAERVPGPLIAVIGSIAASSGLNLAAYGVVPLGPVPGGLPVNVPPTERTVLMVTVRFVAVAPFRALRDRVAKVSDGSTDAIVVPAPR